MSNEALDCAALSETLIGRRLFEEAILACRAGLQRSPRDARLLTNLGRAQCGLGQFEATIASCEAALALDPDRVDAHVELANACEGLGSTERALESIDAALRIDPASSLAHCFLAKLLLWHGDLRRGLVEQEWHWVDESRALAERFGTERWWDGTRRDARVLVVHEQGRGDLIQMARYLPMVRKRVSHLTLECPADLLEMMRGAGGIDDVVAVGTAHEPDRYDLHVRMMALPRLFGTELSSIPGDVPYLRADPERTAAWRARFGKRDALRVGLVWAGNEFHPHDHRRTMPLGAFAPLAEVRGVRWFALQKGPRASQPAPPGLDLVRLEPALETFAETAAIIEQLDLVVSVDTSVAHLAGALARPVWLLLPLWPDWRWMLERPDSPWYPTMRLVRQTRRGDWETPVLEVKAGLEKLVAGAN